MAKDYKLTFRFGAGVNGASAGTIGVPGSGVTSMVTSFLGLTGTTAPTGNTVSAQMFSCPLAWGGWTSTAGSIGPAYAEDVPMAPGTILGGHSNRNDMFVVVDAIAATTLTTAQTFVAQVSDDAVNWTTVGTGETTLAGSTVTTPTVLTSTAVTASTSYSTITTTAQHYAKPGDLLIVSAAGTNISFVVGGEAVAAAAGQVFEVASTPSATTLTLKVPGYAGTTLKSNALVANNVVMAAGTTPAVPSFTIVGVGANTNTGVVPVSIAQQIQIALPPTAKPYLRIAAYGGGGATGYGVIRGAYIQNSRVGVVR
jgi:hypothetical protein